MGLRRVNFLIENKIFDFLITCLDLEEEILKFVIEFLIEIFSYDHVVIEDKVFAKLQNKILKSNFKNFNLYLLMLDQLQYHY